ncbi:MAG TPA: hypothetical protein VHG30_09255 [Microvirga sp.]|nr:hypothetical protein [Microvirga sp.]
MPRYFFHLWRDGTWFKDDKGQTLKDPDQAWTTAKAAALDLMRSEGDLRDVSATCHFEVTDDTGRVLFEFPFSEATEAKSQPS